MADLDEVLGDAPAKEPVTATPEPATAEAPAEPEAEAPSPEEPKKDEPQFVPLAALHEERERRKELDRRLQALEHSQKPPEPEPVPDMFEDPKGYTSYMEKRADQQARNARLDLSEDIARMHYGDEAVDAALEAMKPHAGTPIHQQVLNARNPYAELIKWHKTQKVAAEIGDPDAWREAERARIKAEVEAELAVKQVRDTPAPSLAGQPNLGARRGPEWSGPTPLDKVLG